MKKIYTLLFLVPFLLLSQLHGQGYLEVFGLRTWAIPQPQFSNKGWGGGMNILNPKKAVVGKDNLHPLDMQFGVGFYASGFGVKKFTGVPLLPPLTGNATVKLQNVHMGVYGMLRFSSTNKISGRMPYLDFIGGYRYVGSSLGVMPDKVPAGYSSQTDSTMYRVSSLMYGIGAGMQIKLSDHANLDFELTWTYAPNTGNIVDL
ncbi:MAG TPA: hypothetical protein VFJ43_01030, partial [Bacteroidia bacterium]|nr:hypothetical protein [Bacteroidia bacterium]